MRKRSWFPTLGLNFGELSAYARRVYHIPRGRVEMLRARLGCFAVASRILSIALVNRQWIQGGFKAIFADDMT